MTQTDPVVASDDVVVDGEDGLRLHFDPSGLQKKNALGYQEYKLIGHISSFIWSLTTYSVDFNTMS